MEPTTIIQDRRELQAQKRVRKVLLIYGILSSLLFVGKRISTYVYDLWQVVLSIVLLRDEKRQGASR